MLYEVITEALCHRIIIIDKGRILYDGKARQVHTLFGAYRTLKLQIENCTETVLELLNSKLINKFVV